MRVVDAAELVTGHGLVGDRFAGLGIPGSHVTLIAAEGVEAMVDETAITRSSRARPVATS